VKKSSFPWILIGIPVLGFAVLSGNEPERSAS
jgi:hypothetical protein